MFTGQKYEIRKLWTNTFSVMFSSNSQDIRKTSFNNLKKGKHYQKL